MKELYQKIVRPSGRWTDQFLIAIVISFLLILVGQLIGPTISNFLVSLFFSNEQYPGAADFMSRYALTIGEWIVILLVMAIFKKNWPMLKTLKFHKDHNNFLTILMGLGIGFLMNGFCVLMSCLLNDIHLAFYKFDLKWFVGFLIAVFIQSGSEELGMRGYLYQKLRRRYRSPYVAILVNSLFFTVLHMLNPNFSVYAFLQITVVALFWSFVIYYFDNLWLTMAMHTGWNFTQSIIFGLPNSGIISAYSLFKLDGASDGIFYNVGFGIEGSLGGVLVCVVGLLVTLYLGRGKKEHTDYWLPLEQEMIAKAEAAQQENETARP